MTADFEQVKNRKAAMITATVALVLTLLFFWVKWSLPVVDPPVLTEELEVNLGSGDEGFGSDQPLLPGEPAPAAEPSYTPPQATQKAAAEAKDVETDDRPTNDAIALPKPATPTPKATQIAENNKPVSNPNPAPQPVVNNTPPRPKAVLGRTVGGNGNGGNGAETYKPGGSEGIAGGNGDQGRPGGDPNSRNYDGPRKNFGVRVLQISDQSFEDDFNENAKIAMDVEADPNGKVTNATFQPRGSTTSNRGMIDIARRRAFQLKLGTSDGGQKGTVIFNFKVKG
ncbi:hypothetical protein SAMN05444008_11989 [Cnuella takakiae]|uniref:Outer membrane transport energization protein TonB n=1 Tax=Cnuella takakiae TaxID=1302690 RepID=A0A1M5HKA4_9BACT|nr:hypothetical protein [Cnuella takakiae]SHG16331.1 hypothetical protein SAMN05444008_11989 [Cnuella takakiae]